MRCCIEWQRGQASVEAAFVLPVFLILLGLMAQPALMLYTRSTMYAAAAETCRMLETSATDDASARAYATRRLAAIPNAEAFHCGGRRGWSVECTQAGGTGEVEVRIAHRLRPLPLLGVGEGLAGRLDASGLVHQEVSVRGRLWPQWAQEAGTGPGQLAGMWE